MKADIKERYFMAFGGDLGGPSVPNHFKFGGVSGGVPLGITSIGGRGSYRWLGVVGYMPRRFLIHG